ncbi:hypothetical protein Droror1_Dr00018148 [Drosera rotundifolia]
MACLSELADSSSSYGTDNNHLLALQFHGQQEVDYSFTMSMIDKAGAAEQLSGHVCGRDCLEGDHGLCCLDFVPESCTVTTPMVETDLAVSISSGVTQRRKSKVKVEGQPSKNLMAERRRRRRLNDRLSMLRSIVPKISKRKTNNDDAGHQGQRGSSTDDGCLGTKDEGGDATTVSGQRWRGSDEEGGEVVTRTAGACEDGWMGWERERESDGRAVETEHIFSFFSQHDIFGSVGSPESDGP